MDFNKFALSVHTNWGNMAKAGTVFQGCNGDDLWAQYLAAFPEGTNPIYLKNTEHDCACCRNFIKNIGTAVVVDGQGRKVTVWDCLHVPQPYATVAEKLATWVKQQTIVSRWVRKESQFGAEKTREARAGQAVKTWYHFHGVVLKPLRVDSPDATRGAFNTSRDVLARTLAILDPVAVQDVLDLIADGALYRGQEFKAAVQEYQNFVQKYEAAPDKDAALNVGATKLGISHFKNSVIGTLVEDLSTGKDLEAAVKMFESKVAPTNYKRTSQLVTPKMIEQAMVTIKAEGLEPAMQRRGLRMEDLQVTNLLWAGQAAELPKSPLEAMLFASAKTSYKASKGGDTMSLGTFLAEVLPRSSKLELVLKNHQTGSLMALTTGAEDPKLFKWDNPVAWSYNGDVTDSIAQRVKSAGGAVDVPFRISLAWANGDDMDLHVYTPNGEHVYYGNRRHRDQEALDVDMNGLGGFNPVDPVENCAFRAPDKGQYRVRLNLFFMRRGEGKEGKEGYTVELATPFGSVQLHSQRNYTDVEFVLDFDGKDFTLVGELPKQLEMGNRPVEHWGIKTLTPIPVKAVMKSPNHWAGEVGNLHWMFLLDGALNPNPVRGFYNEFLRSDLEKHRKVLDLAGSKSLVQLKQGDLCGAGFSSTKPEVITLIATTDEGRREYQVQV